MNVDLEEVVDFVWKWSNKFNAHMGKFWNYTENGVKFQGINSGNLNEIREVILTDLMQDGVNSVSRMKGYDAVLCSFYAHSTNLGLPTIAYSTTQTSVEWNQGMLLDYIVKKAHQEEQHFITLHKKAWGVKSPRP